MAAVPQDEGCRGLEHQRIATPFSILASSPGQPRITKVEVDAAYHYYGAFAPEQAARTIEEASKFVSQNSDAEILELQETLAAFLRLTKDDYNCEKGFCKGSTDSQTSIAAWFTIRMTKPTLEYTDTPRWHRDGRMYTSDEEGEVNSKYAMTLLGNPTRALAESGLVSAVIDGRGDDVLRRAEYAQKLSQAPLVDIQRGQIIRFSWGQSDSPVHSEPDMSSDRVFISLVYGSEMELRNMCEIRSKPYRG